MKTNPLQKNILITWYFYAGVFPQPFIHLASMIFVILGDKVFDFNRNVSDLIYNW